jgi:hypothetical protein
MGSVTAQFSKETVLEYDVIQVSSKSSLFRFDRSNAVIKVYKDNVQVKEANAKKLIDTSKPHQSVIEIDYPFNRMTPFEKITVVVDNLSDEDTKYILITLEQISLPK